MSDADNNATASAGDGALKLQPVYDFLGLGTKNESRVLERKLAEMVQGQNQELRVEMTKFKAEMGLEMNRMTGEQEKKHQLDLARLKEEQNKKLELMKETLKAEFKEELNRTLEMRENAFRKEMEQAKKHESLKLEGEASKFKTLVREVASQMPSSSTPSSSHHSAHTAIGAWDVCPYCDKTFTTPEAYTKHVNSAHFLDV